MTNIIKHKEQRVVVLIDVQNMYHSAKNLYQAKVNFEQVLKAGVGDRKLIRAFAYVVRTESGQEKGFFEALTNLGIETRVKDLKEYYGGLKKADWDVGIAVDAIRSASAVDTIILVSGDGDFAPLVEYLKHKGKRVEAIAFDRSASSELKEAADGFLDLEQDPKKFLIHD